ncbi:hypothetical protein [Streptosporangium sp. NPDC049304]|uniref:hypothetical protein n=1 Tax=Streptosporangium sp. NPDC049304 TaxID=3154830 RepID=UPI00343CF434
MATALVFVRVSAAPTFVGDLSQQPTRTQKRDGPADGRCVGAMGVRIADPVRRQKLLGGLGDVDADAVAAQRRDLPACGRAHTNVRTMCRITCTSRAPSRGTNLLLDRSGWQRMYVIIDSYHVHAVIVRKCARLP